MSLKVYGDDSHRTRAAMALGDRDIRLDWRAGNTHVEFTIDVDVPNHPKIVWRIEDSSELATMAALGRACQDLLDFRRGPVWGDEE